MNARFRETFVWMVLLTFAGAAWGQPPCKETVTCAQIASQDLWQIPTIPPIPLKTGEVLRTALDVQLKSLCVPTTETSTGSGIWNTQAQCLRTYVYPGPDGKPTWGYKDSKTGNLMVFPGPTFRLRKSEAGGTTPPSKGNPFQLRLTNSLDVGNDGCKSACSTAGACPAATCDPTALANLMNACASATPPANCCCIVDCTQKAPNCFHGYETTNLHYHGSHISPQEHQDFVLLELKPESARPKEGSAPEHGAHGAHSKVEYGFYDYLIPEFGPEQPEGTHWYHPHKHGSTSVQMLNGMSGAMIIDGAFDDWLLGFYKEKGIPLVERIFVLQQISANVNLFTPGSPIPQTLVNGQVNPTITVKAGEVQRWRFINATMQQSAQIKLFFPSNFDYRQIAVDGIRYSPANYKCQPMYSFDPTSTTAPNFACNPNPSTPPTPVISPGNRLDYLVKVKAAGGLQAGAAKRFTVQRQVVGGMSDEGQRKILLRDEALAPGTPEPSLFTVVVEDAAPPEEGKLKATAAPVVFPDPAQWPKMPDYLRNITNAEVAANPPVSIAWQQVVARSKPCDPQVENCVPQPWPWGAKSFTQFFINGKQFDASCANVTMRLDTAAEWTVSNATKLNHPFHIHTNPFQLTSFNGSTLPPQGQTEPEPVWMDAIALPKATTVPNAAPKDLKTPVEITPTALKLRQRYETFTGQYVLHCHFLGHEDRGMMFSVQSVCKDKPAFYGQPGSTPECAGTLEDALDDCK
ncbi:MAG TPA: multicopper oxidase domain-containing protein [Thermoanaerobaculia bacterium]|nr:multicopper oxidase domain-containing protein [Thermoanaerobaculia bacterium]